LALATADGLRRAARAFIHSFTSDSNQPTDRPPSEIGCGKLLSLTRLHKVGALIPTLFRTVGFFITNSCCGIWVIGVLAIFGRD
jgi:hypothetical protein